jgi:hypothetical protein
MLALLSAAQVPTLPAGDKAVGVFDVQVSAAPLVVEVEEPLILTVEIRGKGPTRRAPVRVRLQGIAAFDRQFYVEDKPDAAVTAEPNRWTFRYRLRPKSIESNRIPGIALEYLHPNGQEQTAYSESIALVVKPRSEKVEVIGKMPEDLPDAVRHLATRAEVLRRDAAPEPLASWVWVVLLLAPPLGCWLWFSAWRRRYPNASRRARMHRSLSAGRASRTLHKLRRGEASADHAAEVAAVVTGYLTEQLHLNSAGLTPREAALCLVRAEVPTETVAQVAEFFRACDAERYAPPMERRGMRLAEDAEQIIAALEAETCFARRR